MTITAKTLVRQGAMWRMATVLSVFLAFVLLAACGGKVAEPLAGASDLRSVDGETAHLQCQGAGSPTLVFLGGQGYTTTTWGRLPRRSGDGTTSASQVEQVTSWPDIPFEVLRHDGEVYAAAKIWNAEVEA